MPIRAITLTALLTLTGACGGGDPPDPADAQVPAGVPDPAQRADPVGESRALIARAQAALEAEDIDGFAATIDSAVALRPGHQTYLYYLVWARTLQGELDAAFEALTTYSRMGLVFDLAGDERLAPLREDARFEGALAALEANRAPIGEATAILEHARADFIPEGIAFDASSGDHFLGSVRTGEIFRITGTGQTTRFAGPESGLWSAMGIRVDEERGSLWVATTSVPNFEGYDETAEGRTAIARFDLATAERTGWFEPPPSEAGRWFGDLIVAEDGTVYTTDSLGGGVFALIPGAEELHPWVADGVFPSPQGLALSGDGQTLYVADYARGIAALDVASGSRGTDPVRTPPGEDDATAETLVRFLSPPVGTSILGIDGLYAHNDALIAIQNGIEPHRVIRIGLSPSGASLTGADVLLANHPSFAEPTLGSIVDDALHLVANSQWFRFDPEGGLPPASELIPPVVLRLELGG